MADFPDVLASLKYSSLSSDKKFLGRGKFGEVYKARCKMLNKDVAVKIITDSKTFKEKEIEVLVKGTVHPNVVSIDAVIIPTTEEEKFWIVMEYCDYNIQQIRDKITDLHIPWARWVSIMRDILSGLMYLHSKEFVHCDLKPENVLVNNHFEAKIADVGLSRIAGKPYISREKDKDIVLPSGTLQYISPERFQDPYKAPEFSDDYYSCGLLFYKIITNEDLFQLDNNYDETDRYSSLRMWLCNEQYRHPLENLGSFKTPQEVSMVINILWDLNHRNRIAENAQEKVEEALNKYGYNNKGTLREADQYVTNLMEGKTPSNPKPVIVAVPDEVDSGGMDFEDYFDDIAKLDGISNWRQFARQGLRLKQVDLQEIEEEHKKLHEQKVAMLKKWQDTNGLKATVDQLEKALKRCNLILAAQKLRKIEGLSNLKSTTGS